MTSELPNPPKARGRPDQRVLVAAPTGCDAEVLCSALNDAGIETGVCATVEELCRQIDQSAAAAILAEEALTPRSHPLLVEALAREPEWSDFPLIVMATPGESQYRGWQLISEINGRGHAILLQRPVRKFTLLSSVRAALRSRARQYQVRDELAQRRKTEQELKATLQENNGLLREVHHRVKNNLQVISSLIDLQKGYVADPAQRAVFADLGDRVRAMSVIHERLYNAGNLAEIDFAAYARSLLQTLWQAHGSLAAKVRLNLALEPVTLPIEPSVPLGLILNELATNVLKHAFQGRATGEMTVRLGRDPPSGEVSLSVRDDGVGLPPDLDWRQSSSLGWRLVHLLVRQLRGSVELNNESGTEFRVTFTRREEG
jgi:two-component sensor histidine kinase